MPLRALIAIALPLFLGLAITGLAVMGHGHAAGYITLDGITFSEASSNFRPLGATGTGSLDDPIILVEEVFGEGEVVVAINVEAEDFGSRVKTMHAVGFALQKVVINRTKNIWTYYALELEFETGRGSDYYDGLSFAQMSQVNRPFQSDRFSEVDDMTEPRDVIRFTQGEVAPGQRVRFAISITHTGIQPKFFLVQHVRPPYAHIDEPDRLDKPILLAQCAAIMGPEDSPRRITRCRR